MGGCFNAAASDWFSGVKEITIPDVPSLLFNPTCTFPRMSVALRSVIDPQKITDNSERTSFLLGVMWIKTAALFPCQYSQQKRSAVRVWRKQYVGTLARRAGLNAVGRSRWPLHCDFARVLDKSSVLPQTVEVHWKRDCPSRNRCSTARPDSPDSSLASIPRQCRVHEQLPTCFAEHPTKARLFLRLHRSLPVRGHGKTLPSDQNDVPKESPNRQWQPSRRRRD